MRPGLLLLALLLAACGGRHRATPTDDLDADLASLPDTGRPALQYYAVLTADADALQGEAAIEAMWRAVGGQGARYHAIRRHVTWVPGDYTLGVTTDFAALPHPQVDRAQLLAIARSLPEPARAKAQAATQVVFLRSDAEVLPSGNHIRLAGLAALYAADQHDGIIIDLIARRAWTPEAWHAELSAPALTAAQRRLSRRADADGTTWLYTRGNPKFGRPDLQMRRVPSDALAAAMGTFSAAEAALLTHGGEPGARLTTPQGPVALMPCEAPEGFHDQACVELPAP